MFYNGYRGGADIRPAAGEKKGAEPWAKYEGAKAEALDIAAAELGRVRKA